MTAGVGPDLGAVAPPVQPGGNGLDGSERGGQFHGDAVGVERREERQPEGRHLPDRAVLHLVLVVDPHRDVEIIAA